MNAAIRHLPLVIAALLIAVHPLNAELFQATPSILVAEFLIGAAGIWMLLSRSRQSLVTGTLALFAGALLAPLVAWPAFIIPLGRRDAGWRRFAIAGFMLGVAAIAALSAADLQPAIADLSGAPVFKVLEVLALIQSAAVSVIAPLSTPHMGAAPSSNPLIGALVLGIAISFLIVRAQSGVTRRWHAIGLVIAVGTLATIAPTLLGRPHLSTTALLVWSMTAGACLLVGWALGRIGATPRRRLAIASVIGCAVLMGASTFPKTVEAFDAWSNDESAWARLLVEDPTTPYRWDYSLWLRSRGDHDGARREALRYLKGTGVPEGRQLEFALVILNEDEDASFDLLRRLDGKVKPRREADVRALLGLYDRRSAWTLYFGLADGATAAHPELRLEVAKAAARAGRTEVLRANLAAALAEDEPTIEAFELGYRDALGRQDIPALTILGDRAIRLFPESFVGYAARGKAAKIVRKDDEMIVWHEKALERDPNRPDLRWDLGIVYHGREGAAALAARHYRSLLELIPTHPQRETLETWIAALTEAEAQGSNPMAIVPPPPDPDWPRINELFTNVLTPPICGDVAYASTCGDPVYPTTGDVRIHKPDLAVSSVGFPFSFWRCYRSGVTYDGPLGPGWDFNSNMHMELTDSTHIKSYDGTCRQDTYTYNAGVFEPPKGRYDTITYDSSTTTYTRKDKDGFKYVYDRLIVGSVTRMRIKEWKDTNANVMSFHYDNTNSTGKLTRVHDTTGRDYTFAYDGNGRITTLNDFGATPRVIKYEYHSTANDLIRVTELYGESTLARATSYTYDSSHRVLTITDGKENATGSPVPFVRNYYAASGSDTGKLLVQEYGPAAADLNTPNPTSAAFIFAYSPSTNTTTFTDRAGTGIKFYYDAENLITKKEWQYGTTYPKTEFGYDDGHQITLIKKNNGDRIEYAYDSSGNVVTAKTTDSSGGNALTSSFAYGTFSRLTQATDPAGVVDTYTYDSNGNLITQVSDSGHLNLTTVFHYDSANKYLLDWTDDPKSIRTSFSYDGSYRVSSVARDPGGLNISTSYGYDEFGNVTSVTDPRGSAATLSVNRLNQVTQTTAPSPLSYYTKFYYDRSDNLTKMEVQNGSGQGSGDFVVDMEYDLLDNLTKKIADIDGSNRATTEYYYDLDDKLTRVKAPQGNETKWVYDAYDLNTEITVGYGASGAATYKYSYDGNFRLVQVEEPRSANCTTQYAYDHHDRVTKVTNAYGHYVKSTYADHRLTVTESFSSGDVLLAKTTYAYDSGNRLTTTEVLAKDDAGNNMGDGWLTSTVVYDANGNVVTTKDDGNHETHFTYDNANRVSIIEDAVGSKVTYTYDANGNVVTRLVKDKQENVSGTDDYLYRFEYDKLNRCTKSYDPGNYASTFTYDARNLVTTEDPNGYQRYLKYDELNRTLEVDVQYSSSNVITTRWEYDKNSRLTKLIDAKNYNTTYAYDALDRVVSETYPDTGTRSFTYDLNSNIATVTDQNATAVTYAYDYLNRLTKKTFSISASHIKGESTQVDFTYDALNRLATATDTDSKVIYLYNTLGLVESEEERYGAGNLSTTGKKVEYDYNSQGLPIKCRYPNATSSSGQLEYTYDILNRLSKLERRTGASTTDALGTWTFKGPSRVIKKEYANGSWAEVTYDSRANVSSIVHKKPDGGDTGTDPDKILECGYAYDNAGKVKSEALTFYKDDGTVREDKGFTYLYDRAYRLTKLYRGVPASDVGSNPPSTYTKKVEYTFDLNSNRQTVATTPSGQSTVNDIYTSNSTNSYTNVNFAGTSVGYQYDAAGNRTYTDENAKVWYYDYQNHVVEIRYAEGSTKYVEYDYDALGRRFAKHYNYDGLHYEANKVFYYAGAALIQEYDKDDQSSVDIETEYFYGQSIAEPVHIRTYDPTSAWTLVKAAYYHQDAYGSVYAISGTSNPVTLVENYRYTEYGEVTVNAGDTAGAGTPFGNKWAWQSHYYDFEVTNVASGVALYAGDLEGYDPELGALIVRAQQVRVEEVDMSSVPVLGAACNEAEAPSVSPQVLRAVSGFTRHYLIQATRPQDNRLVRRDGWSPPTLGMPTFGGPGEPRPTLSEGISALTAPCGGAKGDGYDHTDPSPKPPQDAGAESRPTSRASDQDQAPTSRPTHPKMYLRMVGKRMDRLVNNRGWYQYEQVDYDTGEVIGGIVELQMTEYQVKVEAHKDWEEMMDKYGPMGRGSETLGAKLFGKNGQMAVLFMFGGGLTPGGRLTPGVPRPGKGAAKLSPNFKTPTNPPQPPPETIPDGWNLRIQVNGEPGTAPGYEDFGGYWILTNSEGHPVNPGNGMKTASGRETYHVPLPKGWTRPK